MITNLTIADKYHILTPCGDSDIQDSINYFRARAEHYRLRRHALKYAFLLLLLAPTAGAAVAQTIETGASVIRSSNFAPPGGVCCGGNTFPGAYVKTTLDLPKGFEFQSKVRASRTPQLQSQFTTDEPKRTPAAELRIAAEGRYNLGRVFFAAGVEYSKQFFPGDRPGVDYSQSHNLNPTVTAGVRLTYRQEASFTYLFKDRNTYLYGYRANYAYIYPIADNLALAFGLEANRYTFRETDRRGYFDPYYERDTVFLFDVGIRFGRPKLNR